MRTIEIPKDKQAGVEKALSKTFGTIEFSRIELLEGGLSSALNYNITVKGSAYVLKIIKNISAISSVRFIPFFV